MQIISKKYKKIIKELSIGMPILIFIVIFNFRPNITRVYENEEWISRTIGTFESIVEMEKTRRSQVEKIISIINDYNQRMKHNLKLAIAEEIYDMSIRYSNLDIELICATITHESARTWDPNIISPAGAMGLMQVMPTTGKELAAEEKILWISAEENLLNPIHNIRFGCRYLSMLIHAYNIDGGLAAYNGGMKYAERWVQNGRAIGILPNETAFYVPSVLKIYKRFKLSMDQTGNM